MTDRIRFGSFDVETIPRPDLPPECVPQFDPDSVALGNLKDSEKIGAARIKFDHDQQKKASTDFDRLMVCCFCAYDSAKDLFTELFAKDLNEERDLLFQAWEWAETQKENESTMISFNGRNFDAPALYRRAMLQDVRAPLSLYRQMAGRSAIDRVHLDLMLALGKPSPFSSVPEVKNFEYYLSLFGLPGKIEGWDGSKVYPAFLQGWFEDIQIYCRNDVEALNALFRRVQPWIIEPVKELGKAQFDRNGNGAEEAEKAQASLAELNASLQGKSESESA